MKAKLLKFLKEDGLTVAIVLALAIAYIVLRTPGDEFTSMDDLTSQLASGKPTVVEFYSNTCSICLVSKPKVDELERDLAQQADVLRLNVKEGPGQDLASRWLITGTPTFIVLNGKGEAVYRRAGSPDVDAIKGAVASAVETANP
jgi:thiol-disulfide isomerase/thioredoxin